jgi:hypothetical protein
LFLENRGEEDSPEVPAAFSRKYTAVFEKQTGFRRVESGGQFFGRFRLSIVPSEWAKWIIVFIEFIVLSSF